MAFPKKEYWFLEDPDVRRLAAEDPRGFFEDCPNGAVIDEVQRVPELFSYIQGIVDADSTPGQFILTGSHQPELHQAISQTLAGRTALLRLLFFLYRSCFTSVSIGIRIILAVLVHFQGFTITS